MIAPRCRYHQHKKMKLVSAETPMFHQQFRNLESRAVGSHLRRMIWRCPVETCPWVEAAEAQTEVTEEDRRRIPEFHHRYLEMA